MDQRSEQGSEQGSEQAGGGPAARYRERLSPSPGVFCILAGVGAALGLIMLPIGPVFAWSVGIVGVVALVTLGWLNGAVIEVAGDRLRVGRATIPLRFVSTVDTLDRAAMRVAGGTGLDARAHLCLRGWVHTGVRLHIDDPADPTPYWLVSTRRPAELAAALTA